MSSLHDSTLLVLSAPADEPFVRALGLGAPTVYVQDVETARYLLASNRPHALIAVDRPGTLDALEALEALGTRVADSQVMLIADSTRSFSTQALHRARVTRVFSRDETADQLRQLIESELSRRAPEGGFDSRRLPAHALVRALYQFVLELPRLHGIEQIADCVVRTTAHVLDSRKVSLMLPDADGNHLRVIASIGLDPEIARSARAPVGVPIAGQVFAERDSRVINDPADIPDAWERRLNDPSHVAPMVCVCLVGADERAIGVLNVTQPVSGLRYDEFSLLTARAIADATAIALENQLNRQQRDDARDSVILALSKLAEYRDPETGSHLQRLQAYCRLLAEALAQTPRCQGIIDSQFVDDLVRSAPLHDIGKVGIADSILKKPGRHTPEEIVAMRRHTIIGGDTLRSIIEQGNRSRFLQMGMEIAYNHHEKWDGSGYPFGLRAEQIPLAARILALADVYDALTTRRVYKEPIPHDVVRAMIMQGSGRHFDPLVAKAFLKVESDFAATARALADVVTVVSDSTILDVEYDMANAQDYLPVAETATKPDAPLASGPG